ncbi:MAG: hypothetical protein J6B10_09330 [Lachnospiraceae bacterium]|nr:hypothetical protein [Lachnospiraceae bacterium]
MLRKGGFIFTNKNHPWKAVMATILGILAWITVLLAIHLTYRNGGQSTVRLGAAGLLSFLFGAAGLVLAVMSRLEKDKYYLFSYLGIGFNAVFLCLMVFILYAGM